MHVTVVTVTYGQRGCLLEKTVRAALDDGADRVIVIDNESQQDILGEMDLAFPGRHRTIRLEPNQGSAGYFYGLKAALGDGAEYVLLLDDDNVVKRGAIASLKSTYCALLSASSHDLLCIAGLRMEQEVMRGNMPEPVFPDGRSFLGFDVSQLLTRPWKRLPWGRRDWRRRAFSPPAEPIRRKLATYGGMFFHRALIERFGYPDPRFVVYYDDVEFTNRIASQGGDIWLDPHAEIDDIDSSWQASPSKRVYFEAWIKLGTNERVYYHLRNHAFIETHNRPRSLRRQINRVVLIPVLWLIAARVGKLERFRLIVKAVRDGESDCLEGRHIVRLEDSAHREAQLMRAFQRS